jgi:hypothetical protein
MDASFCVAGLTQPHLSAESAHEAYFFGKNLLRMSFAKGSCNSPFFNVAAGFTVKNFGAVGG